MEKSFNKNWPDSNVSKSRSRLAKNTGDGRNRETVVYGLRALEGTMSVSLFSVY